nr:PSP1 domain-containing protein [Saprospiraceae bacterium]
MACTGCSPEGCGDKGHCATGSCNKMNTYDWINALELSDPTEFNLVEVSFKNGANKEFYVNEFPGQFATGDIILVEAATGYDVGQISLMGELVRMQLKKKGIPIDRVTTKVIRKANERDLEKLYDLRKNENPTLVRARAIAYSLGLDMKIGDVQYQGDGRKATFFYTAQGRVDFRELVKEYAKEFKVKIEMRQIGSRQESSRIGGIGSCGRELCCSTWLSD